MRLIGLVETFHQLKYNIKFATHALIALVEDNPEIFKGQ